MEYPPLISKACETIYRPLGYIEVALERGLEHIPGYPSYKDSTFKNCLLKILDGEKFSLKDQLEIGLQKKSGKIFWPILLPMSGYYCKTLLPQQMELAEVLQSDTYSTLVYVGLITIFPLLNNLVLGRNFEQDVKKFPKDYQDDLRAHLEECGSQRTRASFETFI